MNDHFESSAPRSGFSGKTTRRALGLLIVLLAAITFKAGPAWLDLGRLGNDAGVLWLIVWQYCTLIAASALCWRASRVGGESDRAAWRLFTLASLLYLVGNTIGMVLGLMEIKLPFPSIQELSYYLMGLAFALGMYHYGEVGRRITATNVYNFALIWSAISVALLLLFRHDIEVSKLTQFGTIAAFVYTALWASVAAFGVMSFFVYNPGARAFPFAMMILAVSLEAFSDFRYANELISGTYGVITGSNTDGGITQLLWVTSTMVISFAAFEHVRLSRADLEVSPRHVPGGSKSVYQAALPAIAIFIVMEAASFSGVFGDEPVYVVSSSVLGIVFAAAAGFREHSIIVFIQSLRKKADDEGEKLSGVLESTSDCVINIDREWCVDYFNRRAEEVLAGKAHLKTGVPLWVAFPEDCQFPFMSRLANVMRDGRADAYEGVFGEEGPDEWWFSVNAYPSPTGMSIFFRDVTESRRSRLKINDLALRDTLTKLDNRFEFHETLGREIAAGGDVGVLLLDLDYFKEINDTRGHPIGDIVLVEVAQRLRNCVGDRARFARLGGDEFAVVLRSFTEKDASRLAENIIEALGRPVHLQDGAVRIGASIGIALGAKGASSDILVRNADIALYDVKSNGRGSFAFFEQAMETLLLERNGLKQDLAAALENNQFELFFQPLVKFETGEITSFEALLRWRHPERGLMPPDTFIPLIEETGLVVPIGAWVMRTACKHASSWPAHISVAVNVSTKQFCDQSILETVEGALRDTGLSPSRLELEITESALLTDTEQNVAKLEALREMGLRIALDDFGTGYSSIGYFQKFDFDKLKIDKSFIQGLIVNPKSNMLVGDVISMGKKRGMKITAEGVETMEQYHWLAQECQEAQGHLISQALPSSEVHDFIENFEGPGPVTPISPIGSARIRLVS